MCNPKVRTQNKKLAIMQPYFLPYIGYFQLINAVDQFVVYDNIKFTKKGWIRRNRILLNGADQIFSLPLRKDSDYLDVCNRYLADSFAVESKKLLRKIYIAYHKAPFYLDAIKILKQCLSYNERNLFKFIFYSFIFVFYYLGIYTSSNAF